jgi:hypothetical protein
MDSTTSLSIANLAPAAQLPTKAPVEAPPPPKAEPGAVTPAGPKDNGQTVDVQA